MNSKKAKRLRQLVKHLQEKGAVENGEWTIRGSVSHEIPVLNIDGKTGPIIKTQSVLHAECGRSVYKQMKRRATVIGK